MAIPEHDVSGVLLLDKPAGLTSQAAVSRVKKLLRAAKAGHTGTLDPMATGLLPIALGEATKFSHVLLDADKAYRAVVRLGTTTTTGDLEGEVLRRAPVDTDRDRIESVLARFIGEIEQIPPMYSALKYEGRPLYAYAREGTDIERAPRRVRIDSLVLIAHDGDEFTIDVSCSKGTYIRVLAEDIGGALGCGACLAGLTRTRAGGFSLDEAIALERLDGMEPAERRARLLPVDALLAGIPRLTLTVDQTSRVLRGQAVELGVPVVEGPVRVYGADARFIGLGMGMAPGRLVPKRLVAQALQA
jgi:tRNA pseudouridine55 synthase